jgi:hypothetical protein
MDAEDFQDEVIDRLARIETKQDMTNGRVTTLESNVTSLLLSRSESKGANRVLTTGAGLLGGAIGGAIEYFFRR